MQDKQRTDYPNADKFCRIKQRIAEVTGTTLFHVRIGTIVYEDFEERIEEYLKELCRGDEDSEEELKRMVETKEPAPDWGIVELDGKTYYIMYCL